MKDIALSALKRFRQWLSDLALHQNWGIRGNVNAIPG